MLCHPVVSGQSRNAAAYDHRVKRGSGANGLVRDTVYAITHPLDYSGRARRWEYWSYTLVVAVAVNAVAAVTSRHAGELVAFAVGLVLMPSLIAVTVRRLHDTGRSGAYALYYLVPLIGGFWVWSYCVQRGDERTNRYGQPPRHRRPPC